MPDFTKIPFQQLQRRHPGAFYQSLIYSHYKITGPTQFSYFLSTLIIAAICLSIVTISVCFMQYLDFASDDVLNFNISILILIVLTYPILAWAYHQARFSSKFYAIRLRIGLYIQCLSVIGLSCNIIFWQNEHLMIIIFSLICFSSIRPIWIESTFLQTSQAVQRIQLQKIRQLSYWAYLESKKNTPQKIEGITDLKQYYQDLHLYAFEQEHLLSRNIQSQNKLSYWL
jgi:hypothetical protein